MPPIPALRLASNAARAEVVRLLSILEHASAAYRAGELSVEDYRDALRLVSEAGNLSLSADRALWSANIDYALATLDVDSVEVRPL